MSLPLLVLPLVSAFPSTKIHRAGNRGNRERPGGAQHKGVGVGCPGVVFGGECPEVPATRLLHMTAFMRMWFGGSLFGVLWRSGLITVHGLICFGDRVSCRVIQVCAGSPGVQEAAEGVTDKVLVGRRT